MTEALLEALGEPGEDGEVWVGDIISKIKTRVPSLAESHGTTQIPIVSAGVDFPVAGKHF